VIHQIKLILAVGYWPMRDEVKRQILYLLPDNLDVIFPLPDLVGSPACRSPLECCSLSWPAFTILPLPCWPEHSGSSSSISPLWEKNLNISLSPEYFTRMGEWRKNKLIKLTTWTIHGNEERNSTFWCIVIINRSSDRPFKPFNNWKWTFALIVSSLFD
jgi:hypothetical protein